LALIKLSRAGKMQEERWRRSPELRDDIFNVMRKIGGALNPSSVIATIDEDGSPHTAPFGSLHAINPKTMRVVIYRYHDTLANIIRDERVMICIVCPPDIAVSVKGRAKVIDNPWIVDERYALAEIEIDEVKNDMPVVIEIESGITISATGPFQEWWTSCWNKLYEPTD
jgi:hypothetical protein